jgi:hypothetical protein
MDAMKNFLQRLLRGGYVGLLEADVARLRAENRALMNSLLGTAGFPPVEFPEAPKPQSLPRPAQAKLAPDSSLARDRRGA